MSIYRYSTGSMLADVRVHHASDRPPVALLTAAPGASAEQLSAMRHALESASMQCVPAFADGKEVLQVVGFKDAEQLNALLAEHKFIAGQAQIQQEADDTRIRNWSEWLHRYSLKAAGWLNLIGDVSLIFSGLPKKNAAGVLVRERNSHHMVAGTLYTAGALAPALFGEVKSEDQVGETLTKTADVFQNQSLTVPQDSSLQAAVQAHHDKGLRHFLHQHAASTMLGFYTLGAATMLRGGMREGNSIKIAYGVNSLGLKALTWMLPEKPATEKSADAEPRGALSRAYHWLIDKPLRLFGIGSFVSDGLLAAYTISQRKADPAMWITTGTYLTADVLAAMSSKDPSNSDKFTEDQQRRIEATTAEVIARQPETIRETLITRVTDIIAERSEIRGDKEKVRRSIGEQVKHMASNPWAQRTSEPVVAETEQKPAR